MNTHNHRRAAVALLVSLSALGLSACSAGSGSVNRSLESVHQPVVQRTNFAFDVNAGPGGLGPSEQRRLGDWFDAMELRYGDRVTVDDPLASSATRASVEQVAGRYGLLLSDTPPATPGEVRPGTARVIVTRASATVPGCPDWGTKTDANFANATAKGFGCAVNGNLAAMVADPEHLVHGATSAGQTVVMSSTKAIDSYRERKPSGSGELKGDGTGGK